MIDLNFDYSKVKGSTELHNEFKKYFKLSVSQNFPNAIVLDYDVAKVRAISQPEIIYQVGNKGVLDTIVLLKNIYIFFDMKTGKNKLQKNQIYFKERIYEINKDERAFKINSIREGLDIIKRFYDE